MNDLKDILSLHDRFKKLIVWFSTSWSKVTDKLHLLESKLPTPLYAIITDIKNTVNLFRSHSTGTLGASLSYYMIFSITPIMVIIVSVGGAVLFRFQMLPPSLPSPRLSQMRE